MGDDSEDNDPKTKVKSTTKKKPSQKISLNDFQKRGIMAASVVIPLLAVAVFFQEEIRQFLSEVARSFAVVSAVLSVGFGIPFAMDVTLKKGLRMIGFFCVATGFYLISLGGVLVTGLAILAIGIMTLMLAF